MLVTLFIWLHLCLHAFIWGEFFERILRKKEKKWQQNIFITILIGVVFIAVYTQFFHFFHKFDFLALLILNGLSLLFFLLQWRHFITRLSLIGKALINQKRVVIFGGIGFCLLLLLQSTSASRYYDTDLYHAQIVKWAEEYKAIPGLGNLYSGFALNSSIFTLYALFSFSFLFGQSMHAVVGFTLLVFGAYCYQQAFGKNTSQKHFLLKNVSFLFLLFTIFHPSFFGIVSSLSPDLVATLFSFLCVLLLIKNREEENYSAQTAKLILIFSVFAVTVKLSVIVFLLINFFFIGFYLKNRSRLFFAFGIGMLIFIPYVIKTAVVSGYLLYPLYSLDVLNVDWKMTKASIYEEMMWIRSWNRVGGEHFQEVLEYPLGKWLPIWFAHLFKEDFVLILSLMGVAITTFISALFASGRRFLSGLKKYLDLYFLSIIGLLFWFIMAPAPRFGHVFLVTPLFLIIGYSISKISIFMEKNTNNKMHSISRVQWIYALIFLLVSVASMSKQKFRLQYNLEHRLIFPGEYGEYEMKSILINNVMYYHPVTGDRMGYAAPLPSTPYPNEKLILRGESMEQGFRITE